MGPWWSTGRCAIEALHASIDALPALNRGLQHVHCQSNCTQVILLLWYSGHVWTLNRTSCTVIMVAMTFWG